jgi:hypothetical protein
MSWGLEYNIRGRNLGGKTKASAFLILANTRNFCWKDQFDFSCRQSENVPMLVIFRQIKLYPKGIGSEKDGHLSIYLTCANSLESFLPGCKLLVDFSISILDLIHFNNKKCSQGSISTISLVKFMLTMHQTKTISGRTNTHRHSRGISSQNAS